MSNFKISFIGGGNMAEAILSRALSEEIIANENVSVFDISEDRLNYLNDKYAVRLHSSAVDAVEAADIIFFSVKPQHFAEAAQMCESALNGKAVISIMAGVTTAQIKKALKGKCRVLRVMPNTPALVGEAMSVLCSETDLAEAELAFAEKIFKAVGETAMLSEKYIDAVTGVSGSGPAYVYLFIEAMADAGVLNGLPRDISYKLAAQTVLGAAKMVLETGKHPGVLKDMVTSPGGTTIEAIASFENDGFRGTVINAVNACTDKSKYLSKAKDEEN